MQKSQAFKLSLILLLILSAACNTTNSDDLGSPAAPLDDNTSLDSPRTEIEAPPTATSLPPTWTPIPLEQSEHLSNSASSVIYSGTRVIHVVEYGETLSKISIRYGAPITDVARINNIRNWDLIEVGQVLTIPLPSE